jgi:hypothetical protein
MLEFLFDVVKIMQTGYYEFVIIKNLSGGNK